jgi:hypothetical protein
LREQRDRAEKEVKEEKDLHERELTDYKMKIHSLESEVEKLQVRMDKAYVEKVSAGFLNAQCVNIHFFVCRVYEKEFYFTASKKLNSLTRKRKKRLIK